MAPSFFFTEHVRTLTLANRAPAELSLEFFDKLRSAVVGELRRRSLWGLRPARLGVYGAASWSEPGALDELVADCYVAAVLERLPSLAAQLRRKDNIEGLVFRNIGNYLYEQQRRHDPLGFRTFNVLQRSARRAIRGGRLRVLAGDRAVRNSTVLGPVSESAPESDEPFAERVQDIVPAWIDDRIWPDLVTARGRALDSVETRLAERLEELVKLATQVRFRDVVTPLKNETRRRWQALWSHSGDRAQDEDGEVFRVVRRLQPCFGYEERQELDKLLDCIDEAIERAAETPVTSEYLWRLWSFLRFRVADDDCEEAPSRRRIAELLEIPRNRMADLFVLLAEWTESCREVLGAGPRTGTSR